MQYQSDYILRLIEQMGTLIRRALERADASEAEESYELLSEVVGLALDADPRLVSNLAPQSLVSLLEIESTDDRVLGLLAQAFESAAGLCERDGDIARAALKRDQAKAVRQLLDPSRAN